MQKISSPKHQNPNPQNSKISCKLSKKNNIKYNINVSNNYQLPFQHNIYGPLGVSKGCPQPALYGVALALAHCQPNSDLLVMTQATSLYPSELKAVLPMAVKNRVRVSWSSNCSDPDDLSLLMSISSRLGAFLQFFHRRVNGP